MRKRQKDDRDAAAGRRRVSAGRQHPSSPWCRKTAMPRSSSTHAADITAGFVVAGATAHSRSEWVPKGPSIWSNRRSLLAIVALSAGPGVPVERSERRVVAEGISLSRLPSTASVIH